MNVSPRLRSSSPQQPNPVNGSIRFHASSERSRIPMFFLLSILLHAAVIGGAVLIILLLQFFGFKIPILDPLAMKPRDIEFVIVDTPKAPPRNKATKNRAEHESRSGGEKTNLQAKELPMKKAGAASKQAKPTPPPQARPKPQNRTQPKSPSKPVQQAKPVQKQPQQQPQKAPTPPKPPTPKAVKPNAPVVAPKPFVPTIKTPMLPTPKSVATGPVVTTPSGATGASGVRGIPGPSQIPGAVSPQSGPSGSGGGGRQAGSNGTGAYNQAGSPGGGGGRPGIDAIAEPDYGAYMAELQRRIKRNWHPPSAQEDKRVVVNFRIARDGRLLSLALERTSGYPEADQAALSAVRLSAPFRPLPAGHPDNDLSIQFTFDYNVYKNRGGGLKYQ